MDRLIHGRSAAGNFSRADSSEVDAGDTSSTRSLPNLQAPSPPSNRFDRLKQRLLNRKKSDDTTTSLTLGVLRTQDRNAAYAKTSARYSIEPSDSFSIRDTEREQSQSGRDLQSESGSEIKVGSDHSDEGETPSVKRNSRQQLIQRLRSSFSSINLEIPKAPEVSPAFVTVDFNSAIHAGYLASQQVAQGASHGPDFWIHSIKDESSLLAVDPKQAIGSAEIPNGVADFACAMGVSGIVAPLAGLGIYAGISEIRETQKILKEKKVRGAELCAEAASLRALSKSLIRQSPAEPPLSKDLPSIVGKVKGSYESYASFDLNANRPLRRFPIKQDAAMHSLWTAVDEDIFYDAKEDFDDSDDLGENIVYVPKNISEDAAEKTRQRSAAAELARTLIDKPSIPSTEEVILRKIGLNRQIQRDLKNEMAVLENERKISTAGTLADSVVATKSLSEIGLISALAAIQKKVALVDTVSQSATLSTAAFATGVAGTLVLGPIAGLFSTGMGAFLARKTFKKRRQLKRDFMISVEQINADIQYLAVVGEILPAHTEYADFIRRQGRKRLDFFGRLSRLNKIFLTGCGLYTATATTKMVVSICALAAAGALASNPVGHGILLGVGIFGAVVMGVASIGFFKNHKRQANFAKHESSTVSAIDREFMASLDEYNSSVSTTTHVAQTVENPRASDENSVAGSTIGLALRAQLLEWLDVRKNSLKELLEGAACTHQKLMPRSTSHHVWSKINCSFRTGLGYLKSLCTTFSHDQSKARAASIRMAVRRDLGATQLEQWLDETADGKTALLTFLEKDLIAKAGYLELERDVRISRILNTADVAGVGDLPSPDHLGLLNEEQKHDHLKIEKIDQELQLAWRLFGKVQMARKQRVAHIGDGLDQSLRMHGLGRDLQNYLGFDAFDDLDETNANSHPLGNFLVKDLYHDIKKTRGILFETQLQAARFRQASESDIAP